MAISTLLDIEKIPFDEYTDDNKDEYLASIAVSMKRTADYLESINKNLLLLISVKATKDGDYIFSPESVDQYMKNSGNTVDPAPLKLDDEIPF